MRDIFSASSDLEWSVIDDPEQARLLSDPTAFRYFEPFLARESTVSRAAEVVGCGVDTMLYRVRKFCQAGLLRVSRSEKRAGRPIKHYRSTADAYFVPLSVTPFATVEERLANQMRPFNEEVVAGMAHLIRESGREGRRIYRGPDGEVWTGSARDVDSPFYLDDPDMPAAFDVSARLRLDSESAKSLQHELRSLFERYKEVSVDGKREYLLQIALLPAPVA